MSMFNRILSTARGAASSRSAGRRGAPAGGARRGRGAPKQQMAERGVRTALSALRRRR